VEGEDGGGDGVVLGWCGGYWQGIKWNNSRGCFVGY
jgi:hypothetical protein